jgi:hypothetical protein
MFNREIVLKTLRALELFNVTQSRCKQNHALGQDKEISYLLYELFGGEILKTKRNKVWHFYNRIEGKREDCSDINQDRNFSTFDDFPSSPDETKKYFDAADYVNLYYSFIRMFDKIVGFELAENKKSKHKIHLIPA